MSTVTFSIYAKLENLNAQNMNSSFLEKLFEYNFRFA